MAAVAAVASRTSHPARSVTQGNYGNVFLLLIGGADRRLHVRVAAADGGGAGRGAERAAAARRAGPAGPGRARRRAAGAGAGAAPGCRARREGVRRARAAGGRAGARAALADPPAGRRRPTSLRRRGRPRGRCSTASERPAAGDRGDARRTGAGARRAAEELVGRRRGLPGQRARPTSAASAPAWVLLRGVARTQVVVSVRDDGPGIPPGRLEEAAREGGSASPESIRGRIADLGGTARPGHRRLGTEWELSVPRLRRRPDRCRRDHPQRPPVRRPRGGAGPGPPPAGAGGGRRQAVDLRGRDGRAGLTGSSLMVAGGEPGRMLALLDPDSDLAEGLRRDRRVVVHLLRWAAPRPRGGLRRDGARRRGGPFRTRGLRGDRLGPRLASATRWAGVRLETTGDGRLVGARDRRDRATVEVGDAGAPLVHRRGRPLR